MSRISASKPLEKRMAKLSPSKMNNSPEILALNIKIMYDIKSKKRKKSKPIAMTHVILQLKILQVFDFQNSIKG